MSTATGNLLSTDVWSQEAVNGPKCNEGCKNTSPWNEDWWMHRPLPSLLGRPEIKQIMEADGWYLPKKAPMWRNF